jgi:CheY-like chemotaxis protein
VPPRSGESPIGVDRSGELRGLRILVVDDDGDGREMLAALLQLHGAQAIAAASADEALAALERDTPDLLISDIGMPRVDGYELMRRIRGGEPAEVRTVPAIALTAFARPVDTAKAFEAGFGAHLAKPVEAADLLSTIAGLLRTRRAPRARMSLSPTPSRSA